MEAKLEQYRLRKRRKQNWESFKDRVKQFIMPRLTETSIAIECTEPKEDQKPFKTPVDEKPLLKNATVEAAESDEENDIPSETTSLAPLNNENKFYTYTLRTVLFFFWATLYVIAIELKFGIVFLMLSALIGIFLNTRTGPKKPGEISAYSVFNENCESIDGTLKAEQFEKELFYKPSIGK